MSMSRWADYYLDPDFSSFWRRRLTDPKVTLLTVLGVGFDPRCLAALKLLGSLGAADRVGYLALKLIARPALGKSGAATDGLAATNLSALTATDGCHAVAVCNIETHDEEGHNIAGRKTLSAIEEHRAQLTKYTDVLVDISGMPRGVFYPLIAYLLKLASEGVVRNLHVTVVEDPILDSRIKGREYGQADYLHTFRLQGDEKLIWVPLVGANENARLDKIYGRLKSSCIEILPILPFPASSLRRVDDIAVAHSELLFESFLVSPDNLLLCDERNPFDVYRKVLDVAEYYNQRLSALPGMGSVKTVVSPLSSKTLSLGMLLAAIERSLPVCHVEPGTYDVVLDDGDHLKGDSGTSPTEIWLAGEPYIT
jgi:hypothetical protein